MPEYRYLSHETLVILGGGSGEVPHWKDAPPVRPRSPYRVDGDDVVASTWETPAALAANPTTIPPLTQE